MNLSKHLEGIEFRSNAAHQAAATGPTGSPPDIEGMSQDDVIEVLAESIWDVPYLLLKVQRVQALLEQYEADDQEHLNTFGQHHPYAGWAADHLREALTGEA